MINLSEQWKKDELLLYQPYYIKLNNGAIRTSEYRHMVYDGERCVGFGLYHNEVEEVLAPVPSYEEWQQLKEFADYSLHNRDELTRQINFWMDKHTQIEKENQKLKELLKRCRDFINYEVPDHCIDDILIDKIDEVLK